MRWAIREAMRCGVIRSCALPSRLEAGTKEYFRFFTEKNSFPSLVLTEREITLSEKKEEVKNE